MRVAVGEAAPSDVETAMDVRGALKAEMIMLLRSAVKGKLGLEF